MDLSIKAERKFLAHYIDAAALDPNDTTGETDYIRIGKDLEEYTDDLQNDITSERNILGENHVVHNGFTPQSGTEMRIRYNNNVPEKLAAALMYIANERRTGALTTKVDVLVGASGKVIWAYRENVVIIPESIGGSSDIVVSYSIAADGDRELGSWNVAEKKFQPDNQRFLIDRNHIIAYLGRSPYPEVPMIHDEMAVRTIGSEAFINRSDITSIMIPDGMEVIE